MHGRLPFTHACPDQTRLHSSQRTRSACHGAQRQGTDRTRCRASVATDATTDKLLEAFWEARGVFDPQRRQQLVSIARQLAQTDAAPNAAAAAQLPTDQPLPGIPTTWALGAASAEVHAVSQRLLALHGVLGAQDDVDVIWMVVREPALMATDLNVLLWRLLQMKLAAAGASVDVVKVVERQPGLLLLEDAPWRELNDLQECLKAWEFGLASDADPEWEKRYAQLAAYHRTHGDCGVGFRDGDDAELARWASKQRFERRRRTLDVVKGELLQDLGFEFDEDEAEWLRWFLELARFFEVRGHSNPMQLSSGDDMYLINWCSVQRVAYRCKQLSQRRLDLMASIQFDWTGADPLS